MIRLPVPVRFRFAEYADRWEREHVQYVEIHAAQVRSGLLVNAQDQGSSPADGEAAGPGMHEAGIEIASWTLASELVRRAPHRLRLIKTHPAGGLYDCLSVFDGSRHVSDLNRRGSLHVTGTMDGQSGEPFLMQVWPRLAVGESPRKLLDEWCRHLHLAAPTPLPASTATSLTYRVIAACLKQTSFDAGTWRCVEGVLDTSGWCGGVQAGLFEHFPKAQDRLRVSLPEDLFGQPAYRFWFLERDEEPRVCLETSQSTAWLFDGTSLELMAEYQRRRRNVHAIAALLISGSM